MLRLDNTKRDKFVSCPRKYYWEFVRNIRPVSGSCALRYGIAFHAGMEKFYETIRAKGWSVLGEAQENAIRNAALVYIEESKRFEFQQDDYRTIENLTTAIMQYVDHFHEDEGVLEVVEPERIFEIGMKSYSGEPFQFTGKIDLIAKLYGRLWIMEFKTTGWSLPLFLNQLNRSAQIIGYYFASTVLFQEPPDGVLVSVHYLSSRKVKSGDWGKVTFDYGRSVQMFQQNDVRSWRLHLEWVADQIIQCADEGHWPCNFDSCYRYGMCAYSSLCEQDWDPEHVSIDSRFKEVEPWDPSNRSVVITE